MECKHSIHVKDSSGTADDNKVLVNVYINNELKYLMLNVTT